MAGCQSGPLAGAGDATRDAPISGSVQLIERDVEAPEVFSAEDSALWDGRPSLGGVWVAAPDVREPERVIIRNAENGKFVIGALFKRERDNPGPALQLSSDAAVALGILAGAPTTIDVVALRREEVSEPTAAPASVAPNVATVAETPPLNEEIVEAETPVDTVPAGDAITAATAALDEVDAASAEPAAEIAAGPGPTADAAPEPRRRGFFGRLFNRNRVEPPAPLPAAATAAVALPAEPVAENAAAPEVTATSLDAAPVQTASAAPARSAPGLDRAYVQIGIFSVEENANNTATALSNAGVLPTVLAEESRGRKFWRVIVGPSTTSSDRAAVIRKAKDLGFTDAFAIKG
ncbi:SPOR domain-containing protein [Jannaschia sp. S6380]|nr:SPOR domain-containing protein [Jannaschia sp. S6380]MCK0166839.1 SPOR domain-containing protein [Jannaschia sp. S6380]